MKVIIIIIIKIFEYRVSEIKRRKAKLGNQIHFVVIIIIVMIVNASFIFVGGDDAHHFVVETFTLPFSYPFG